MLHKQKRRQLFDLHPSLVPLGEFRANLFLQGLNAIWLLGGDLLSVIINCL